MIHVDLSEWSQAGPSSDPRLRGFRFTDGHSKELAARLARCRMLELTVEEHGLGIRSFAHVGRIELGGIRVTVRPKLAPATLMELVRYAYSLRHLQLLGDARFPPGDGGLQDLLIAQLRAEAREILSRGVARRYVRRTEELASPKGRIELARLARASSPALATLPCSHYPRSSDFLLNQVVRSGLELGRRLAGGPHLRRQLARTIQLYSDLAAPVRLNDGLLRAADESINRQLTVYEPALRLTRALYEGSHLALEDGATMKLKGFLFDMNRFFQALLSRFLRESLPDCELKDEFPLGGMMVYRRDANPQNRRPPRPRPDFAVRTRGTQWQLLDAKYRDLWENDLPRDMLYQLAVYAMSQPRAATAAILYPTDDGTASESIVDIREPMSADVRASIALRPIVIDDLLELVRGGGGRARQREKAAHRMVFGESLAQAGRRAR